MEEDSNRKDFAMVIFHNIPETYPTEAHINCAYTLTPDMVPNSRDWVGLYKVGWLSTGDYNYYEWAPTPKDYVQGQEAETSILFPAHRMPGDDGEFYQFCYVTNHAQIRGASTPFQFKKPSDNDFVELEDPENDMLVVRSKAVVLEEKLQMLDMEKQKLVSTQEELKTERDGLIQKLISLDKQLTEVQDVNKQLSQDGMVKQEKLNRLQQEAADMVVVQSELQTHYDTTFTDRNSLVNKVKELNQQVDNLATEISLLQGEKDAIEGENQNLKQQLEMYKNHCLSNEMSTKEYNTQIENLKKKLQTEEEKVLQHREELSALKAEHSRLRQVMDEHMTSSMAEKSNVKMLSEQLRNTEDKLEAAEKTKKLLQDEIRSFQETTSKISCSLEEAEDKYLQVKTELQEMTEKNFQKSKEAQQLNTKIQELSEILQLEKEQHDEVKNSLCEQLSHSQEESGSLSSQMESWKQGQMSSMHCLRQAQQQLKERYSKMEQQYSELHKESAKQAREHKQTVKDLVRENEDLKERLNMASTEYKNLYISTSKMQKKLEKYKGRTRSRDSESSTFTTDVLVKSEHAEGGEGTTLNAVEQELAGLEKSIQDKQDKKNKYKQCYLDEKAKVESLRKHYLEENANKDKEICRLRSSLEKPVKETKIRNLENFLQEKDNLIIELEQKVRDMNKVVNKLHDGPARSETGTNKVTLSHVASTPCNPFRPLVSKTSPPPLMYPHPTLPSAPVMTPNQTETLMTYPHPEGATASDATPIACPPGPERADSVDAKPIVCGAPLIPLPVPLQPEKLASSKIAAISSVMSPTAGSDGLSDLEADGCQFERFEDAIAIEWKVCPVCGEYFSGDIDPANFDAHVLSHVGRICPICNLLVEEANEKEFHYHVNKHLEESEQKEPKEDFQVIEFD